MKLREYQRRAIDAIRAQWDAGDPNALAVLPTGAGKTIVASHLGRELRMEGRGKILFIAHRNELIEQARDKWLKVEPDALVGVYRAARRDVWADVICCSIQSCYPDVIDESGVVIRKGRMADLPLDQVMLVIVDECFPAGTDIDGRAIETIRVGDVVRSFNHTTGRVEPRQVLRLFKSRPSSMVTVHFSDRSHITCTQNHPIFTGDVYTEAINLKRGDATYAVPTERLRCLRKKPCPKAWERHATSMFCDVLKDVQGIKGIARGYRMLRVRNPHHDIRPPTGHVYDVGARVLLDRMLMGTPSKGLVFNDDPHESGAVQCQDDREQPHAQGGVPRESERNASGHWAPAQYEGGQRSPSHCVGIHDAGGASGMDSQLRGARAQGTWRRVAHPLQDRRGEPGSHGGDRSRRQQSLRSGPARGGCQERRILAVKRVDRVEVHQPSSGGGYGGVCPDGYVYNFEVDGNHNYFADGVLVHNCHHLKAGGLYDLLLQAVRKANPDALMLGITATPYRADGAGLGHFFRRVAVRMGIADGIRQQFLVPLRGVAVRIEFDLSKVTISKKSGDFIEESLGNVMDDPAVHAEIVKAWLREVGPGTVEGGALGRITIAFTPTVATAVHLSEAFAEAGVSTAWISGAMPRKERARVLADFEASKIRVLVNCMVLVEGFDSPAVACALMARPTKSNGLYCQQIGRAARMLGLDYAESVRNGKPDSIILDCVGNTKLGLASMADLTDTPEKIKGIDPDEDELVIDPDAEELQLGDDIVRQKVIGFSTYEVDLFSGNVQWARIKHARVVTLDMGHSLVCWPVWGKGSSGSVSTAAVPNVATRWSVAAFHKTVEVLADGVPEKVAMSIAEAYADAHGVAKYLRPPAYSARQPASEKQRAYLANLVDRNRARGTADDRARFDTSDMPAPATMGRVQIGHWITYLRARLEWATARKSVGARVAGGSPVKTGTVAETEQVSG